MVKIVKVFGISVVIFIVLFLISFFVLYSSEVDRLKKIDIKQKIQDVVDTVKLKTYVQKTIKGNVIENNHSCAVDVVCYIKIKENKTIYEIVYGQGLIISNVKSSLDNICLSKDEGKLIWDAKIGQKVEVSGPVNNYGNFYTCPDDKFTIKLIK